MIGIFVLRNASRGGIVNLLAESDLQGLGDDYLSGYVRRVLAVSPAEVQRIATTVPHARSDDARRRGRQSDDGGAVGSVRAPVP